MPARTRSVLQEKASVGCVLRTISPRTVALHRQKGAWDAPYTCLVFGLIASTLLVLLVVPTLYTILEDFGFTEKERDMQTTKNPIF
jgi:multidrug efflux pump subunit AcrB